MGIIFGVAAVITMLAIGNGAEKEILSQIELVGLNNIVVTPLPENEEEGQDDNQNEGKAKKFSKGLDLKM